MPLAKGVAGPVSGPRFSRGRGPGAVAAVAECPGVTPVLSPDGPERRLLPGGRR